MNTVQRIAKNTAALFAAQVVVAILSLILSIFIARNLGAVFFGKYSFALAFTAIFAVVSDLGYNTLLIREVARDKSQASKYLNNVISMRALMSLVNFAFIVITINVMGYPTDTKNIVYLFGVYTLVVSFSAVFKVTFRAFEKMLIGIGKVLKKKKPDVVLVEGDTNTVLAGAFVDTKSHIKVGHVDAELRSYQGENQNKTFNKACL